MKHRTSIPRQRTALAIRSNLLLRRTQILAAIACACMAGSSARAQDLFVITATGGGNPEVRVGGDNLLELIEDAVNTRGAFDRFANTAGFFSLNYGGIEDAIIVVKNDANTQAELRFGPTGVSRTFTGVNQDDLENQIEAYLKKGGGQDVSDFLKQVNARSVIAVSDGNPNATTARMARFSFDRFGIFADQFKAYRLEASPEPALQRDQPPAGEGDAQPVQREPGVAGGPMIERRGAGVQLHVGVGGSTFEAGDFEGESATVASSLDLNFSPRVGLSVGSFLALNTIGDADVFHGAVVVGVPVRVALPDEATPISWQITPSVSVGGSGSEDIGAGGLIFGGAVTNFVAWHVSDRWTLAMANQLSFFEGETLEFDDFEIDPGVSQSMLSNGLRATYRMSDRWYGYVGVVHTMFLDDASVESWISPTAGIGYGTPAGTSVQLGVFADTGDDYDAVGGRVALSLAF